MAYTFSIKFSDKNTLHLSRTRDGFVQFLLREPSGRVIATAHEPVLELRRSIMMLCNGATSPAQLPGVSAPITFEWKPARYNHGHIANMPEGHQLWVHRAGDRWIVIWTNNDGERARIGTYHRNMDEAKKAAEGAYLTWQKNAGTSHPQVNAMPRSNAGDRSGPGES